MQLVESRIYDAIKHSLGADVVALLDDDSVMGHESVWHIIGSIALMSGLPEGFFVPIHRFLTDKVMLVGIPRKIAILNGTMIISLVVGAHNLWVLPIGIVSHLVLVALHRRDQDILTVIKRNLNRPSLLR